MSIHVVLWQAGKGANISLNLGPLRYMCIAVIEREEMNLKRQPSKPNNTCNNTTYTTYTHKSRTPDTKP